MPMSSQMCSLQFHLLPHATHSLMDLVLIIYPLIAHVRICFIHYRMLHNHDSIAIVLIIYSLIALVIITTRSLHASPSKAGSRRSYPVALHRLRRSLYITPTLRNDCISISKAQLHSSANAAAFSHRLRHTSRGLGSIDRSTGL